MLYLLHGDRTDASREKLLALKSAASGKEIRELDGTTLRETDLIQALESSSLFGGDIMVVIERFLGSAKKREKAFSLMLTRILQASASADVVLYEEKEIEKTTIAKLGRNARVLLFKTPAALFPFLDCIRPGNHAEMLTRFCLLMESEAPELVFSHMVRRVRQLMQILDAAGPAGLADWQRARLTTQARHFTMDKLVAMHERLLQTDIAVKSNISPFALRQHIEQILISL